MKENIFYLLMKERLQLGQLFLIMMEKKLPQLKKKLNNTFLNQAG